MKMHSVHFSKYSYYFTMNNFQNKTPDNNKHFETHCRSNLKLLLHWHFATLSSVCSNCHLKETVFISCSLRVWMSLSRLKPNPCSRSLLVKLTVAQLFKKFLTYEILYCVHKTLPVNHNVIYRTYILIFFKCILDLCFSLWNFNIIINTKLRVQHDFLHVSWLKIYIFTWFSVF